MEFNIENFVKRDIFGILQNVKNNSNGDYYVKGGRAYDIYFKDKTNSIDWDIVADNTFSIDLNNYLHRYAEQNGLELVVYDFAFQDGNVMIQYGFKEYLVEGEDPYFIDVLPRDVVIPDEYTTINGINYMSLQDFVVDLLLTQENRYILSTNFSKKIKDFDPSITEKYGFNAYEIKGKFLREILGYTLILIEKSLENSVIDNDPDKNNRMKHMIRNVLNIVKDINVDNIASDPVIQGDGFIREIEQAESQQEENMLRTGRAIEPITWLDDYKKYIKYVADKVDIKYMSGKGGRAVLFDKYRKTRTRYKNVINMTWDGLSNEFQQYLLDKCAEGNNNEISLYRIEDNDKCSVNFNCNTRTIVKDTSGCISDDKEVEYESLLNVL